MNYINKRASNFIRRYISQRVSEHETVIDAAISEIHNIDADLDRANFLRIILEENAKEYQKHLIICEDKANCETNYDHESISYFLAQELNRLGIRTNNDQFAIQERDDIVSKLDTILLDIQTLKYGQQIIYDDFNDEVDSLKELFILGKKTWFQLFVGKMTEMVISGVISETISKEIIALLNNELKKLN